MGVAALGLELGGEVERNLLPASDAASMDPRRAARRRPAATQARRARAARTARSPWPPQCPAHYTAAARRLRQVSSLPPSGDTDALPPVMAPHLILSLPPSISVSVSVSLSLCLSVSLSKAPSRPL